jgi:hypothetical protein
MVLAHNYTAEEASQYASILETTYLDAHNCPTSKPYMPEGLSFLLKQLNGTAVQIPKQLFSRLEKAKQVGNSDRIINIQKRISIYETIIKTLPGDILYCLLNYELYMLNQNGSQLAIDSANLNEVISIITTGTIMRNDPIRRLFKPEDCDLAGLLVQADKPILTATRAKFNNPKLIDDPIESFARPALVLGLPD